ncbi:TetR/AcrR family transcriptional regulator [Nonomuraea sp. NPDC050394]|uniref:TetR/AcrR family transcriptional regulator n=1 Tax=Nonomuraea sp. NPDC050394 TaxID=3364363 RepID=UPI00379EEF8D
MSADQVLEVATKLFAELGYDETDIGLIARAAGVEPAFIGREFGGKADLYKTVMLKADEAEHAAISAALAQFTGTPEALHRMVDAYLDFFADNPMLVLLWMHRWMGDAADIPELEEAYTRPLLDEILRAISPLLPPGVETRYFVWMIVWCVYGFLTGGVLERRRSERTVKPAELARFRTYLHWVIGRLVA